MSDSTKWDSMSDEYEVTIDPNVEVDLSDFNCHDKTIYFKPDGYIYEHDGNAGDTETMIAEQKIIFKYGNAAIAVYINAMGVLSSEILPNNEDNDYIDDNYDPTTDTDPDTYTGDET